MDDDVTPPENSLSNINSAAVPHLPDPNRRDHLPARIKECLDGLFNKD